MPKSKKIETAYCTNCRNKTRHWVLCSHEERYHDGDGDGNWKVEFLILECLGCEKIVFLKRDTDYDWTWLDDEGDWQPWVSVKQYPYYLEDYKVADWWHLIPNIIEKIHEESLNALKANCHILAWAGFRAVIEAICKDKGIAWRNLEIKINNLAKDGLITKKEAERLHSIRFLWNDSIHDITPPAIEQLMLVLRILDNLIENIYIVDEQVRRKLERPIGTYEVFLKLAISKAKSTPDWTDLTLHELLGKQDFRRIKDRLAQFESKLFEEISNWKHDEFELSENKRNDWANAKRLVVRHRKK